MASSRGGRTVTMEHVATRAGVSRALVSIVMRGVPGASDENRAAVMRAAEELSYRPDQRARLLGRGRSQSIGISFGLHDENHGEMVEALYQAVEGSGFDLILSPNAPTRDEIRAAESLLDYRCETLVLIGTSLTRRELDELATYAAVIVVARSVASPHLDVVRTDDLLGARLATEHLIELGHQRIVHVHGGRIASAAERRAGYRASMRRAGLDTQLVEGGRTEDDGWRAGAELLSADRVTAVFAYNDQCAAGLVARVRSHGLRVPDDIAVVGFDNTRLAASPSLDLTTVAQDSHAIATHVIERAMARAETPTAPAVKVVVPPHLVLRASSGPSASPPATSPRPTEQGPPR